jgi:hypothetical protein
MRTLGMLWDLFSVLILSQAFGSMVGEEM